MAVAATLLAAVPGDAAPAKRKLGVPVVVSFLAGSYANVDAGAGSRQVPLTGFAFGYVPRSRIDRGTDIPIVLLRAEAFPQATDLLYDTTCGEFSSAARLDSATSVELTKAGGRATLGSNGTVTAKAHMAIKLKLDLRAPDGCGQPLAPAASTTTAIDFKLKGKLSSAEGLRRVTMTSAAQAYTLKACLTPGTSSSCAGAVQKIPTKIAVHLQLRVDLGVGGGQWSYPG